MKIKKLIPLLLAAVCLTACADIPPVKEPVPVEQQTVIAPPEEGWTAEELMSVTYFDGIELCYPLTLRDLGPEYSCSTYTVGANEGRPEYVLMKENGAVYEEATYGYIFFESEGRDINADSKISYLLSTFFNINGISANTPAAEIEKALGAPDSIVDANDNISHYIYTDSETGKELMKLYVIKSEELVLSAEILL